MAMLRVIDINYNDASRSTATNAYSSSSSSFFSAELDREKDESRLRR